MAPAFARHGTAFVGWAWVNGHVRRRRANGDVEVELWDAEDQAYPVEGGALVGYFASKEYQSLKQRALDEMAGEALFIDVEAASELWAKSRDPELRERAKHL